MPPDRGCSPRRQRQQYQAFGVPFTCVSVGIPAGGRRPSACPARYRPGSSARSAQLRVAARRVVQRREKPSLGRRREKPSLGRRPRLLGPPPAPAPGIGQFDDVAPSVPRTAPALDQPAPFQPVQERHRRRAVHPRPPRHIGLRQRLGPGDCPGRRTTPWRPPHNTVRFVAERARVLDAHCAGLGRDPAEIVRSVQVLVSYDDPTTAAGSSTTSVPPTCCSPRCGPRATVSALVRAEANHLVPSPPRPCPTGSGATARRAGHRPVLAAVRAWADTRCQGMSWYSDVRA